ncbi:MAG: class I SAM-dependent methyltransferase [Candidatus Hodarchaeota archaeon]
MSIDNEVIKIEFVSFDRVAEIYDETRWVSELIIEKLWRLINENCALTENSRILDLGFGTGRISLPFVRKHKISVIGIDISDEMLKKAKHKLNTQSSAGKVSLVYGDVCYLPFRPQSFDLILIVHLLHLVKQWKRVLVEGDKCLVPKTKQIICAWVHINWHETTPFQIYWEKIRTQGYKRDPIGLKNIQECVDFLKQMKYSFQKFTYYENINVPVTKAFSMLEQRAFSHSWNVSEKIHFKALEEVKEWMHQHKEIQSIPAKASLEIYQFRNLISSVRTKD